ncbi:hypothetical protein CSC39_1328 [Escherichia coli]|nr:hypothetical protein CSC39_1328 [Escherichia coli]
MFNSKPLIQLVTQIWGTPTIPPQTPLRKKSLTTTLLIFQISRIRA